MLECVSSLLEVNAEIVHDCDVIVQFLGRGYVGKPAAFPAFREVDPTASCGSHPRAVARNAEVGGVGEAAMDLRVEEGEAKLRGCPRGLSMGTGTGGDVDGMNGHGKLTPLNDGSVGPILRRVRKDVGSTLRANGQVDFWRLEDLTIMTTVRARSAVVQAKNPEDQGTMANACHARSWQNKAKKSSRNFFCHSRQRSNGVGRRLWRAKAAFREAGRRGG